MRRLSIFVDSCRTFSRAFASSSLPSFPSSSAATRGPLPDVFDYIVVGAGSAGCLVANRLTARPGCSVLLLEAGGDDSYPWVKIPVGYLFTIGNKRTDWCLRTQPVPGLNGRDIGYARGKLIGGCSSINAMIYMRGQAADYDSWAQQLRDDKWKWSRVLPVFKGMENYFGGADEWHGEGGEVMVNEARVEWEILDAWRLAAVEQGSAVAVSVCSLADDVVFVGIPMVQEFNRGDNTGSAYFHVNQHNGLRWSMADAFLHPVVHRSNLSLRTRCAVQRLTFAGDGDTGAIKDTRAAPRVTGVEWTEGGRVNCATAAREVILCAGAVASPQLLQVSTPHRFLSVGRLETLCVQVSGIGPPQVLQAAGVAVRCASEGVGENLQDHLQLRMVYKVHGCRYHALHG
jgi:choline dehydrogenase